MNSRAPHQHLWYRVARTEITTIPTKRRVTAAVDVVVFCHPVHVEYRDQEASSSVVERLTCIPTCRRFKSGHELFFAKSSAVALKKSLHVLEFEY